MGLNVIIIRTEFQIIKGKSFIIFSNIDCLSYENKCDTKFIFDKSLPTKSYNHLEASSSG